MAEPTRRPYKGSCHCGSVKYILYLTLPHTPLAPEWKKGEDGKRPQLIYRCNCTTCQKAGLMHIRVPSAPDDFLLLSPLDPFNDLGDYQCFEKKLHFFFCKNCGVRCFSFMGEGEVVERDIGSPDGKKQRVWHPKAVAPEDGWVENLQMYLSVNGYSLDAGQEGLDLREWTEKKWVLYLDCYSETEGSTARSYERPQFGGAY